MTARDEYDRLLRTAEVCQLGGFSRSYLYKAIGAGEFPQPRRIGKRNVRWLASEVQRWVSQRPRAA